MSKSIAKQKSSGKITGRSPSVVIEYDNARTGSRESKKFDDAVPAKKFFNKKLKDKRNPKVKSGELSVQKKGKWDYLKPYPNFPLSAHKNGYWYAYVNGEQKHFGRWGRMVDGEVKHTEPDGWRNALDNYNNTHPDDLDSGTVVVSQKDTQAGLTIGDLCNEYLDAREALLESGDIKPRTYRANLDQAKLLVRLLGKNRKVAELRPRDFTDLKVKLSKMKAQNTGKQLSPNTQTQYIVAIKTIFKFGWEEEHIEQPVNFGSNFKRPSARRFAEHDNEKEERPFTLNEIRLLLKEVTNEQMRAMILLGLNCGFHNDDFATLTWSEIDLQTGWLKSARSKTARVRLCPLWPETIEALMVVKDIRPAPKDPADADLVFVTKFGNPWMQEKESGYTSDSITQGFKQLMKRCQIDLHGVSIRSLRKNFTEAANKLEDERAIKRILGHRDGDTMGNHYLRNFDKDRLIRVSNTVRDWLFGEGK